MLTLSTSYHSGCESSCEFLIKTVYWDGFPENNDEPCNSTGSSSPKMCQSSTRDGLIGKALAGELANNYMDSLLGEPLQKAIQDMNLDPMPLPDFTIPFRHSFGPVPISGRFDFFNGIFRGLSQIRRLAECEGPIFSLNEVKIECLLNLFGMSTVYDSTVQIEQLPPIPYQVTAYVNETHIKNGISGEPTSLKGKIKAFEITKFGDINVRLSGLGLLQYVYNAVEEQFRDRVREELTKIIIQQFPTAFRMAMTQVSLPKTG